MERSNRLIVAAELLPLLHGFGDAGQFQARSV